MDSDKHNKTRSWIEIRFGDELLDHTDLQLRMHVKELVKKYSKDIKQEKVIDIIQDELRPEIIDPRELHNE